MLRRRALYGLGAVGAAATLPITSASGDRSGKTTDSGGDGVHANQNVKGTPVLDWSRMAVETVQETNQIIPISGRTYALVHASMYDAINGVHMARGGGYESHEPYAVEPDVTPGACRAAAGCGAAHEALNIVLDDLVDAGVLDEHQDAGLIADLQGRYDDLFDQHTDEENTGYADAGEAWGREVAQQIRNMRDDSVLFDGIDDIPPGEEDEMDLTFDPEPGTAQRATEWGNANLAFMEPWVGDDSSVYNPPPPPDVDSIEWVVDYLRTRELGNDAPGHEPDEEIVLDLSTIDLTDDDLAFLNERDTGGEFVADDIAEERVDWDPNTETLVLGFRRPDDYDTLAEFWATLAGTAQPEGRWVQIARVLAEEDESRSILDNARMLTRVCLAVNEASIANWNAKRRFADHLSWRPHGAIGSEQFADEGLISEYNVEDIEGPIGDLFRSIDAADPDWEAISDWTPSPEYPSGLTMSSTASMTVLKEEFGENVSFTLTGDDGIKASRAGQEPALITEPFEFESFEDARNLARDSREMVGRHYRFALRASEVAGEEVALDVIDKLA